MTRFSTLAGLLIAATGFAAHANTNASTRMVPAGEIFNTVDLSQIGLRADDQFSVTVGTHESAKAGHLFDQRELTARGLASTDMVHVTVIDNATGKQPIER